MLSVIRNDEHDTSSWGKMTLNLVTLQHIFFCFSVYFECRVRQNVIRDDWVDIQKHAFNTKFIAHLMLVPVVSWLMTGTDYETE